MNWLTRLFGSYTEIGIGLYTDPSAPHPYAEISIVHRTHMDVAHIPPTRTRSAVYLRRVWQDDDDRVHVRQFVRMAWAPNKCSVLTYGSNHTYERFAVDKKSRLILRRAYGGKAESVAPRAIITSRDRERFSI